MSRRLFVLVVMLSAFFAGCAPIDPPNGYVKVSDQHGYDYKAVSARGNVIACNVRSNSDKSADLKFWTEAIEHQKVDIDGMKLAGRDSLKSQSGLEGVLFRFESGEGQGKTAYLLALYVTSWKIYTIEATGPAESIAKDLDKLRASMQTIR